MNLPAVVLFGPLLLIEAVLCVLTFAFGMTYLGPGVLVVGLCIFAVAWGLALSWALERGSS